MLWSGLLEAPLFESEWNGIRLADVLTGLGMTREQLCSSEFYAAFYRALGERRFDLPQAWLDGKGKAAARLSFILTREATRLGRGPNVLSIGAGLGVMELPLIAEGWDIELQECQAESLAYFRQHRSGDGTRIRIGQPSALPSKAYDVVYLSQVAYALPRGVYAAMLEEAARLLRPGGLCAIWEPECSMMMAIAMRWRKLPPGQVFWGWRRSQVLHRKLAEAAGFRVESCTSLDHHSVEVPSPFRFCGVAVAMGRAVTQELIFRSGGGK